MKWLQYHLIYRYLYHKMYQSLSLAPRQYRNGYFFRVGCTEDKLDVFRRFLERFEQRIERFFGEHVDFVNDVNFKPRTARTHVDVRA